MDREPLNEICLSRFNDSMSTVSYTHISGWKASGAYRLFVRTKAGINWNLVYKNSVYELREIPALDALPIRPGFIEYLVYGCPESALAEYLPRVYLCREVIPGIRYEYFLEDLSCEHVRMSYDNRSLQIILHVVEQLPVFHAAIERWADMVGRQRLPSYDQQFSLTLQKYARTNLEQYYRWTLDSVVADVLRKWAQICKIHGSRAFREQERLSPIHGDLNTTNIWVGKGSGRLKMVDWEWAGLGLHHADLASLLSTTSPEIEERVLNAYSGQNTELLPTEHNSIYQWCKLERGLLDGSFIAAQYMSGPRPKARMMAFVRKAMHRVLEAYSSILHEIGEDKITGLRV